MHALNLRINSKSDRVWTTNIIDNRKKKKMKKEQKPLNNLKHVYGDEKW